jgi:hypothetical protein
MAMEHTSMKCFRNRNGYKNVPKAATLQTTQAVPYIIWIYTVTMHITTPLPKQRQACILAHFDGKPNSSP